MLCCSLMDWRSRQDTTPQISRSGAQQHHPCLLTVMHCMQGKHQKPQQPSDKKIYRFKLHNKKCKEHFSVRLSHPLSYIAWILMWSVKQQRRLVISFRYFDVNEIKNSCTRETTMRQPPQKAAYPSEGHVSVPLCKEEQDEHCQSYK